MTRPIVAITCPTVATQQLFYKNVHRCSFDVLLGIFFFLINIFIYSLRNFSIKKSEKSSNSLLEEDELYGRSSISPNLYII